MRLSPYREPIKREEEPRATEAAAPKGTLGSWRSHHGIDLHKRLRIPAIVFGVALLFAIATEGRDWKGRFAILSIGAIIFASAATDAWIVRSRGVVDLHARGLVLKKLRRNVKVFFEEVDEVWLDLAEKEPRNVRGVRLKRFGGRATYVPLVLEDAQHLLDAIHQGCSLHLLPEAQHALAEGESLDFLEVKLSKLGFWHAKHFVPWENVERVRLGVAALLFDIVWDDAPPATFEVALDAVPHPHALIRLVKHLAGDRAQL